MRPLQPITLSDLILSRLLLVKEGGLIKSKLKDSVKAIAASQLSASALTEQLEQALTSLEEKGYAESAGKARYQATDKGTQYILKQLKLETLPTRLQWPTFKNTYWIAYALGLPALTSETRKRLADADRLRAAILQSEYDLPIDAFSSLTETRNALLWQQLFDPSVAQSLQDQLPQLSQQAFNQGAVMGLLLNNILQTPKPLKWDKALNQLIAKAAGARNNPDQLRLAILRQAFIDGPVEPAFEPETLKQSISEAPTQPKAFSNLELEDFANTVLAAAKDTEEGWFGDHKVFISQVWKTLSSQQPDWNLTLDEFKQKLLAASRKEWINLSRADLGYSLDSEDVAASEIIHLQSQFHFIRTD
ncbi:hypothetical protein [Leptolyngbya sp. BC1307]|uniref:hypothetical protein n=1 Tax=Leptolyngbya sp. BC1307 TaxID=2029589 RepID=UPI000EFAD3C3|nr:hypothetical protein [Leptolyngbya sp. BC1307]